MNVLLVSHTALKAACTLNMLELARELQKKGHKVLLLYAGDDEPAAVVPYGAELNCRRIVFGSVWLARELKRAVTQFDPDLIHLWGMRHIGQRAAFEALVATGAALVLHWEDDEYWVYRYDGGTEADDSVLRLADRPFLTAGVVREILSRVSVESLYRTWMNPFSYISVHPLFFAALTHSATAFTAIWHPLERFLDSTFGRPVCLLPPGYRLEAMASQPIPAADDPWRRKLDIKPEDVMVVSSGSLYDFSIDFHLWLQAFARVVKQRANVYLVLCGYNRRMQEFKALADSLGVLNRIHMLGYLPKSDVQALVRGSDVAICPGERNSFNRLRLPSRIPECMALGKPMVLSSDGFGESLVQGQDAVLVDSDSPDAWADGLLRLVDDRALRERVGSGGRKKAEEFFDIHRIAERLIAFYADVAERHRAQQTVTGLEPNRSDKQMLQALLTVVPDLVSRGFKSVYLYPAGTHTRRLLALTRLEPLNICGIIDDFSEVKSIDGIPVLKPAECLPVPADTAVLVSSDSIQGKLVSAADRHGLSNVFGIYQ
ncbi:MAG: glycosyltransferase family 4 protein [Kiritimatiellae bacterium]|nr:glycosyltransferase family 4 protein [Kiritimatiellia bacterium]